MLALAAVSLPAAAMVVAMGWVAAAAAVVALVLANHTLRGYTFVFPETAATKAWRHLPLI